MPIFDISKYFADLFSDEPEIVADCEYKEVPATADDGLQEGESE